MFMYRGWLYLEDFIECWCVTVCCVRVDITLYWLIPSC